MRPVDLGSSLLRKRTTAGTAYVEVGAGEPLVLLHGVGMRLEAWESQIAAFAAGNRVIAADLPGHGESLPLAPGSTITDFVAWLSTFLRDLGLERANLAGHSMGAMIAGGAVATFPERIARIAYLNGVFRRDPNAKAAVLARAAAIRSEGVDREGPLSRWFVGTPAENDVRENVRRWLGQVNPSGYATAYMAFAAGDDVYADCWPRVACPALFLTGSDDPNSTPEMAEAMAAMTPHGWARIVAGHRHMVGLTAPDEVNRHLAEWLATTEAAR